MIDLLILFAGFLLLSIETQVCGNYRTLVKHFGKNNSTIYVSANQSRSID